MRKHDIKLNCRFYTLNETIKADRSNRYAGGGLKKSQTNAVFMAAKVLRFKLPIGCYNVHFQWTKPNMKMDHDNIAHIKKVILDGLVKAKSIENDSPKYINNFKDTFVLDRGQKHISCHVFFTEV